MKRWMMCVCVLAAALVFSSACSKESKAPTIRIGINAPLTGDIPQVGEGTKFAAQLWLEDIVAEGGIAVGGKRYPVELIIEDNESKAESAVKVTMKMITEDEILIMIGPQSSKQAVPAAGIANNYKTPMITPWSTNPDTTKGKPYVFRACFLDPFQGPVVAKFISKEFQFTKAAVLYDVSSDYPKGLAEFFKKGWEDINGAGSVVAFESFTTKDTDFSSQLTKIINSSAQVLFVPQYYNEVALIVQQASQLGWKNPIVGSDSWGSAETIKLCGSYCHGAFFSSHYAAAGAIGETKKFIDRYNAKYGYIPDDVAALTWDAMNLVKAAVQGTGGLSGTLRKDREAVRNALSKVQKFNGITGQMTFDGKNDPSKCAVIVKISDRGEFTFYQSVCP